MLFTTSVGAGEDDKLVEDLETVQELRDAAPVKRELPEGRKIVFEGVEYWAFTTAEYGEVVKFEKDYNWLHPNYFSLLNIYAKVVMENATLRTRANGANAELKLVIADRGLLQIAYEDERAAHIRDVKLYKAKTWVPWTLLAVQTVVFAIITGVGMGKMYGATEIE